PPDLRQASVPPRLAPPRLVLRQASPPAPVPVSRCALRRLSSGIRVFSPAPPPQQRSLPIRPGRSAHSPPHPRQPFRSGQALVERWQVQAFHLSPLPQRPSARQVPLLVVQAAQSDEHRPAQQKMRSRSPLERPPLQSRPHRPFHCWLKPHSPAPPSG